jgi:CHRD domain-containing protein
MADFRAFTLAASVTAIVLGAGIGAALGVISGPQPPLFSRQHAPASTARATPSAGPAMGAGTVDHAGMNRHSVTGHGVPAGPGVLHLESMPTGTVRVWRDLQGVLQVHLDLYGLTPGSSHTVSIDAPGSTALRPEVRFPAFGADSTGRANATLTAITGAGALRAGSRVGVRLGSYASTASPGLPAEELIAQSAVLPGRPDGQQRAVIPRSYGPAGNYQGRLRGWAKISYSAATRTLSVTVTASGLPPGAHAAHLHLGTCQDQGAVKYMLADYVANASGDIAGQTRTVSRVTAAPPSSGWYLNLHLGGSSAILANGMPTLSFRPELCADITTVQMAGHR